MSVDLAPKPPLHGVSSLGLIKPCKDSTLTPWRPLSWPMLPLDPYDLCASMYEVCNDGADDGIVSKLVYSVSLYGWVL